MKKSTALLLMILVAVITGVLVYGLSQTIIMRSENSVIVDKDKYDELVAHEKRFTKLLELEEQIKADFYQDTSEIDFDSGIIKGLFESLGDQYSEYMTPEEYAAFDRASEGEFDGIGITVQEREDGYITIVSPIKDTPGDRAGLQSGDIIQKIDGVDVSEETLQESVNRMLGEKGTEVTLTILRDTDVLEFTITRDRILVPSVEVEMKGEGVGYLRLNSFDFDKSHDEFVKGIDELKSQGMDRMILDLRNNPGGSLGEVVRIADEILSKGNIVTIVTAGEEESFSSDEMTKFDMPLVVLVNRGSASASEILSGAIKDHSAGEVIGETTFGKGLVQTVHSLTDGSGYKLTTAYYLTPDGTNIHEKGIEPDINYEHIRSQGYEFEDIYTIDGEDDQVLQYAIDHILGKVD